MWLLIVREGLLTFLCKDLGHGRCDGGHESSVEYDEGLLRHASMEEAKHSSLGGQPGFQVLPGLVTVI